MTRISVVSELAGSSSDIAATAKRTMAMLAFFRRKEWEVQLIATGTESSTTATLAQTPIEWLDTYESRRGRLHSPLAAALLPVDVIRFSRAFRRSEPQAVMITGNSPFLLISALLAATIQDLPVSFDVRDSWLLLGAFHPGRLRNALREMMEGFALRRGDLVVAVTPTLMHLLQTDYHIAPHLCLVVPYGTDEVRPPQVPVLPVYDFVHAGPPRDYYDNNGILDAIGLLREQRAGVRAVFLGVEDGKQRTELEEELRRRNLEAGVDIVPWIPEDSVSGEIRKARIGLISLTGDRRYRAAVSTKFYSYLEAEVPILFLGPADSEQARLIREFRVGLVCESPRELAQAAQRLLLDSAAFSELQSGSRIAASRLNWREVLEPLSSRLLELAANRASGER